MGTTTPNIGIYIPSAGETNFDQSFAAGMVNIDLHDHSGAPNKGVPITGSGIADGAVTFEKLNADVADTASGIGTLTGPNANKLTILGFLKSIFQLSSDGFVTRDGTNAHSRVLTGTANQITVTNPQGIAGDPVFGIANPFQAPGPITATTSINALSGNITANSGNVIASNFVEAGLGVTATTGNITGGNGDLVLQTAGNGLSIAEGVDATQGSAQLVAGVAVVNTARFNNGVGVRVHISRTVTGGGTLGFLSLTAGTASSFTITSLKSDGVTTEVGDVSSFDWLLIKY